MLNVKASDKIVQYNPNKNLDLKINNTKKIVLLGGCFDVLHYGHFHLLKQAKQQGDIVIVMLEPDSRIIDDKNRNPIHIQHQRATNLSAITYVDKIIVLPTLKNYQQYLKLVKEISPNIIVVSSEDKSLNYIKKQAESVEAEVKIITPIQNLSSTSIIKKFGF